MEYKISFVGEKHCTITAVNMEYKISFVSKKDFVITAVNLEYKISFKKYIFFNYSS